MTWTRIGYQGQKDVEKAPKFNLVKIYLPPLYIKLGLIKISS